MALEFLDLSEEAQEAIVCAILGEIEGNANLSGSVVEEIREWARDASKRWCPECDCYREFKKTSQWCFECCECGEPFEAQD